MPRDFGWLWPVLRWSFYSNAALTALYAALNAYVIWRYSSEKYLDLIIEETLFFETIIGLLLIVSSIVAIAAWCRLYYRAARNLHAIDAAGMETTAFWAVGTYFIPFVCLWKPLGAMRQIWRGSFDPVSISVDPKAIIGWWWAAWIIAGILGNISFRLFAKSGGFGETIHDPDKYLGALALDVLAAPFYIGAALLAVSITREIVSSQQANVLKS